MEGTWRWCSWGSCGIERLYTPLHSRHWPRTCVEVWWRQLWKGRHGYVACSDSAATKRQHCCTRAQAGGAWDNTLLCGLRIVVMVCVSTEQLTFNLSTPLACFGHTGETRQPSWRNYPQRQPAPWSPTELQHRYPYHHMIEELAVTLFSCKCSVTYACMLQ